MSPPINSRDLISNRRTDQQVINNLDVIGLQGTNLAELLRRLLNLSGEQLDAVLPPISPGSPRLPLVKELKVINQETWPGGLRVTLTWTYDNRFIPLIEKFEVYAYSYDGFRDTFNKSNFLISPPVSCLNPPVAISLTVPYQRTVVFEVKPVLKSGLSNSFEDSNTTSIIVNCPVIYSDHKVTSFSSLNGGAGIAVLVAGVVNNIPCPNIETTDYVVCIPVVLGGVPGIVTGQNIIAKTNFDLISTSVTDTSTIFWYVIRPIV